MDIEDVIKNLAPFGFIIIWVASAVFNKTQETAAQSPARKSGSPPNPLQSNNLDSATVAPRDAQTLDWSDLVATPRSQPMSRPPVTQRPPIYQGQGTAKTRTNPPRYQPKESNLPSDIRTNQQIPDMPADKTAVPQMQLLHLVSDNAANVVLDPALAQHQSALHQPVSQNNMQMQALRDRMKKPGAVRDAMILSVILDEPKCKKMLHKG
jgi:hypothetical protein